MIFSRCFAELNVFRRALVLVPGLLAAAGAMGCDNGSADPQGSGGTSPTTASAAGTVATASTAGAGQTGGANNVGGSPATPSPCHTPVPGTGLITSFEPWSPSGMWGTPKALNGGQFFYQDTPEQKLTATVKDGALTLSGTVTTYAGWGLYFGPCSDASRFTGVSMLLGGTIGEMGELEVQAQTSKNTPIDKANKRGECVGDFTTCTYNKLAGVPVPATPMPLRVPFVSLVGGQPVTPFDPTEMLGLQWQFNCDPTSPCAVEVTLDDLMFYQ